MSPSESSDFTADSIPGFVKDLLKAGAKVYEVGGSVRDALMGRTVKDRDLLVAKLSLEELTKRLNRHGQVHPVGKSFGVLKFYPSDGSQETGYDIALPRKEVSTGVGHRDFKVDYDPNLPVEIDLSRRDFTVNAMARDLATGALIDPFDGEKDLKNLLLRKVSDKAFEEDPLRILRGIQFAARFGLTIDPETFSSMKAHAALIASVSGERVAEEIRKLLLAEKPSAGFILMRDIGVLKPLFPELAENVGVEQGNKLLNDDVFMHTMRVLDASRKDNAIPYAGDLELMLSALFHDVGKARTKGFDHEKNRMTFYGHQILSKRMAKKRMNALKMTTLGINPENIASLVEHHMFQTKFFFNDRSIRRFINKVGPDLILKLVDLRIADNRGGKYPEGIKGVLRLRKKIQDELERKTPFSVKDLALNGRDLMDMGIPEGPEVGKMLKALLEVILDDPEKNTREILTDVVQRKMNGTEIASDAPKEDSHDFDLDADTDDPADISAKTQTETPSADECGACDDFNEENLVEEVLQVMKDQEKTSPEIALLHDRLEGKVTLIGLTGGIASGKSLASGFLSELQIPVIDADRIARDLTAPGTHLTKKIIDHFGESITSASDTLDRGKLALIVFQDPKERRWLEDAIHPAVFREIAGQVRTLHETQKASCIIVEAPLLFESGLAESMDKIILIKTSPELQLQRLMTRDGITRDDALLRIGSQMPTEEKEKKSDFIVENVGTPEEVRGALQEILGK